MLHFVLLALLYLQAQADPTSYNTGPEAEASSQEFLKLELKKIIRVPPGDLDKVFDAATSAGP
jgi:hypothetical protein